MPNIHGDYSPKEIAHRLNVSAAWISKVQSKTGIPRPISTKGAEVRFNDYDAYELYSVYLLRALDYSFEDIKEVYNLEKNLAIFAYKNNLTLDNSEMDREPNNIIRCCIYADRGMPLERAINTFLVGLNSKNTEKSLDGNSKKYASDWEKLVKMQSAVFRRANALHKSLGSVIAQTGYAEHIEVGTVIK
jgi:DNA-binding transcriptional MerR regulator